MSKIRGKDTRPELALRRALWARGARFRVHVTDLPGRPDLANKRAKVAVFVDGCFWHGCPRHFKVPKTRKDFWAEKIARNQATRQRIRTEYQPGWSLVEVFECVIGKDLDRVVERISQLLSTERRVA